MRELKFRGKKTSDGVWVYGGYHEHQHITPNPVKSKGYVPSDDEIYKSYIIVSGFSDWGLPKPVNFYEVGDNSIGQYTGIRDARNKEIYEGDLVRFLDSREPGGDAVACVGIVGWCTETDSFCVSSRLLLDSYEALRRCTVIGNIIDGAEIIK